MIKILILLFSIIVIYSGSVFAEEMEQMAEAEIEPEGHVYHYPEINSELMTYLGYRHLSLTGSGKAGEFEYLYSTVIGGMELRAFPFPHRLHLEVDVLSEKDYFSDISYAYRDIILFRDVNRSLFHNLDNLSLPSTSLDTGLPLSTNLVRVYDAGREYGVRTNINNLFLRFKTPDFPFHVYLDGRFVNKLGDAQERFLGGAGYFFPIKTRISESREINRDMREITLGTNSHLGPVEIDLSHTEKRFDSAGDRVLTDFYIGSVRPAGFYPHNLVPDLKGSTNTIKLHTMLTGSLVGAATMSWTDRENMDSGAKASYFNGSAEVTYVPDRMVTLVARYKHRESDLDNPSSIPVNYLGYSSYSALYVASLPAVTPSLSSTVDAITGIIRYRPVTGIGLSGEYTYERTARKNADDWFMPDTSIRRYLAVSANARILKNLTLKAKYAHQDMDNPPHNIVPDDSDSGNISLSWTPFGWVTAMASYNVVSEKRSDIQYINESGNISTTGASDRKANRERALASLTFMPMKKLSLSASYAYIHNRTIQDLIYNNDLGQDILLDKNVPYNDTAHSYALGINYMPKKNISLNADASYAIGKGHFDPDNPEITNPVSVASFSDLKVREIGCSLGGEYTLKDDWTVGLRFRYNSYKDIIDNPYDDARNGVVRIILVTISKRW